MEPGEFKGTIGRYHWDSTPWWPEPRRAAAGAPNVVLVVLDDVGFAQLGCFGSDIATPRFDALAAGGLRYGNFHTTALCSPTRSCLMTGRNHHSNGMGRITDLATGFPGYDAQIPKANAFLSEMLVPHGYAAWAVGKWHLTPDEETHLAARRDRWPLGRGFERYYGFFHGETHQFAPALVHDNHFTDPPATVEDGYHLTEDLVDHAIEFVHDLRHVDAEKPFFLYLATGACHSPHQAPREWIERYHGAFDDGWDACRDRVFARQLDTGMVPASTRLSERPEWVPAWADLSDDERRVYARYMEAFAGYLSHTDHHVGRLVDALADTGDLDNTIVVLVSDNGASSEGSVTGSLNDARAWNGAPRTVEEALPVLDEIGGPRWHNNYPWGWTVAGNTPFRRWKREVHEGGVADPLIVHWPAGIAARGEVRDQYVHAIDVVPTILDALGIEGDAAVEGVSFAHTFAAPAAPSRHRVQYYEMLGCRALYEDGWKAVVYHPIQALEPGLDIAEWELYHVDGDRSETRDLAATEPERLAAMVERWWQEAERYNVLPVDNRAFAEFVFQRPPIAPERDRYVYWPRTGMVSEEAAVNVRNRNHTITAYVDIPETGADGVLLSQGSRMGGWSLFVREGRLTYVHNLVSYREYRVEAPAALTPGQHTLGFRFEKTAEHRGTAELLVDEAVVATGEIRRFTPTRFSIMGVGLWCGRGGNLAVCDDYVGAFPFTATLHRVEVAVDGPEFQDPEAEAEAAIQSQ